jgi:tripartite ATP-independent transporter DctP family solute receptor
MQKSTSMFVGGLLVGALIAVGGFALFMRGHNPGGGHRAAITLKLGHSLDTAHPVHLAMEFMKKRLQELSSGTMSIDIYPSSVLGSETQCIEQLQNGALDMTKTSAAAMESFIPAMAVFGLPYVFRDDDHYWKVLNGPIGKKLLQQGNRKMLHGLCYYDAGSRNFYTKSKPILTPDDLKGLKIRVMKSKTASDMVVAMGAAATPIDWGELYSALAQGIVEGAENNLPSFTSNKHYEVCKHFTLDGHTRVPDILLTGTKAWNKLSPDEQKWLAQAAAESSEYERKLWQKKTTEAAQKAQAEGVTIHKVDTAAFAAKVAPMLDNVKNDEVRSLVNQIREVK